MQKLQGFTEAGNTTLTITGAAGSIARKVQGSFPSCTITVYNSGMQNIVSGTYTSGGTIVGTVGQTVTLTFSNGAIATCPLTGVNTIAAGTALTFSKGGINCLAAPTSATLSNGTATASGTATVTTVLGLALASIYSDNGTTPKANPFVSSADGSWFFYAANGRYDVAFSGGDISTPFTLGGFSLFDEQSVWINVKDSAYGAIGDGVTDDTVAFQTAIAVAYAAGGGTIYCPPGTYRCAGSLTYYSNITILGASIDATKLVGESGYLFDSASGTTVVDFFSIRNMAVDITTAGIGFLRVGRTSTDYNDGYFRRSWDFRDLEIDGLDATVSGRTAASFTQLINHTFSNVTFRNFYNMPVIDRCGNGTWNRVRFWSYNTGPFITIQGGTGTRANGVSQDVFICPEFLGPTVGTGYTVIVQTQHITFINALYEAQTTGTSSAMLYLKNTSVLYADSANFSDINGFFSNGPGNATLTIKMDDGMCNYHFYNTNVPITGFPPITFGSVYKSNEPGAKFTQTSYWLNVLVAAADPGMSYSYLSGPNPGAGYYPSYQVFRHNLADHTGTVRIVKTPAMSESVPSAGKGIELGYPHDQDIGYITSYDRAGSAYTGLTIQATDTIIGSMGDLLVDKRIVSRTRPIFTDGDASPSVSTANCFIASNSTATSITGFSDGTRNQEILVLFTNANTTLVHSGTFRLLNGVNYTPAGETVMKFWTSDGSTWYEVSRSHDWT